MTKKQALLLLPTALLCSLSAQASVVNITSAGAATANWFWFNDLTNTFTADTISSAQTPPNSALGSVDMSIASANDRLFVFTTQYSGVQLSQFTSLGYETFSVSGSTGSTLLAPTLQINIGLTSTDTTYRGRLVYSPSMVASPDASAWDTWNPYTSQGGWFFSARDSANNSFKYNTNEPCVLGNAASSTATCSLASILGRNSTLAVSGTYKALGFKTGGSNAVENSYADMLTVGVNGADTTFDFQATPEPSTWLLMAGFTAAFLPRLRKSLRG